MLAKLPAARQALLEAADHLEERGFCKDKYCENIDGSGSICMRGAIRLAVLGTPLDSFNVKTEAPVIEAEELATSFLISEKKMVLGQFYAENPHRTHGACAVWNNEPERTKEEVVDALRSAALYGL